MTNTIAFGLIAGFVVYVVVKGQLPAYLGVIGLGSQVVNAPQSGTTGSLANIASGLVGLAG